MVEASSQRTFVKMSHQIARNIETAIFSGVHGQGTRIGSEDDLARKYEVSRWVMREAIAIAEMDGLVECRRGKVGGLYVTLPGPSLRIATLRNYFGLAGATPVQINRSREILEREAINRVMRRLTLKDVDILRSFRSRPRGGRTFDPARNTAALLAELLRISNNNALELFIGALAQVNIDRALWYGAVESDIRQLTDQTWDIRLVQIEAIIAQDEILALKCQNEIAECGIRFHSRFDNAPNDVDTALSRSSTLLKAYEIPDVERTAKKPEAAARLIAHRIATRQLQSGDRIGSENELIEDLAVSRNVLREAIRLLEIYGIIAMNRGPKGGVYVQKPDPANIVRATSLYLTPAYVNAPESFHRISKALQLEACAEVVDLVASGNRSAIEGLARYRAKCRLRVPDLLRNQVFSYYEFLARGCNNVVLESLMESLIFHVDFRPDQVSETATAELLGYQLAMTEAIAAGDTPLVRRLALVMRNAGAAFGPVARDLSDVAGAP